MKILPIVKLKILLIMPSPLEVFLLYLVMPKPEKFYLSTVKFLLGKVNAAMKLNKKEIPIKVLETICFHF